MATKASAYQFVHDNYDFVDVEDGINVTFKFDNGATQLVLLTITDNNIQYMAPFAKTEDVTAKQVLEGSNSSYLGLQLWDDTFTVVHYLTLANVNEAEIGQGVYFCADIAHNTKKRLHLEHQQGLWGQPDPVAS